MLIASLSQTALATTGDAIAWSLIPEQFVEF